MNAARQSVSRKLGRAHHFMHRFRRASMVLALASCLAADPAAATGASEQDPASLRVVAEIADRVSQLDIKRTFKLTSEKALDVRRAIKDRQYPVAREIVATVLKDSHLENWRFYPFTDFINAVSDVTDPEFLPRLDDWVAQDAGDAIPVLVRAQYYHDLGWFVRGDKYAKRTQADHLKDFTKYMELGLTDVSTAIGLDNANPYSFRLKLRILHGFGVSQRLKDAFAEAVNKYPDYYPLYDIMLETLEPKWGGNVAAMLGFADQYAGHLTGHSPLKLIYLALYRDLLDSASNTCTNLWRDKDRMAQCMTSWMNQVVTPELQHRVLNALQLYDLDNHQFNVAVRDILLSMLST